MHLPVFGYHTSSEGLALGAGGRTPPRSQRDHAHAPPVQPCQQQRSEINIPPTILGRFQPQVLAFERLAHVQPLASPLNSSAVLDLAYAPAVRVMLSGIAQR